MRFAIRDDDTNFFTTPAELEECYHDVWSSIPISLAVISKVKGNWKYWVHEIYKSKHETNWEEWQKDDKIYAIEHNTALIDFLRAELSNGRVDLAFHAIHHRNEDGRQHEEIFNNYVRGAEFYTTRNMTMEIATEVDHLKQLFNHHISVFTPPQNLLSREGYQSVLKAGLNICGGGISFLKKEKTLQGIESLTRQLVFKITHLQSNYPYVVNYSHHKEIPYHYPLHPNTHLESLKKAFDSVKAFDGDFVLSTHYAELNYPMTYDRGKTMKHVLLEFLAYVKLTPKLCFTTLSEMLT